MSRTIRSLPKFYRYGWRFIRHPRTTSERRDSEACRVDGIKKRAARNMRNLPSAYDDKVISAIYERDFKA